MNIDMNIENGHELDTEWKRLNKINIANMDTDNELNTSGTLGIGVLKMKIDSDIEIKLQHRQDAYRNVYIGSQRCDSLKLENAIHLVNMDKKLLSDNDKLDMYINNRHDTDLGSRIGPSSDLSATSSNPPPIEQFTGTQNMPETSEKVVFNLTSLDNDQILNPNPELDLEYHHPTPALSQENRKYPIPETPKSIRKIHTFLTRTPPVKRKMNDILEKLEIPSILTPTPLPTPTQDRTDPLTPSPPRVSPIGNTCPHSPLLQSSLSVSLGSPSLPSPLTASHNHNNHHHHHH